VFSLVDILAPQPDKQCTRMVRRNCRQPVYNITELREGFRISNTDGLTARKVDQYWDVNLNRPF
jgi:hypothetical protein